MIRRPIDRYHDAMRDDPPRTDADLMLLLGQTTHALATEMAAGLGRAGISPRAHCVLSKAMAGDFTQGHLAELCDLDRTTMVATLDELEAAGMAERRGRPGGPGGRARPPPRATGARASSP